MSSQQIEGKIDSNVFVEILDTEIWEIERFPPILCCNIITLINKTKYSFDSIESFEEAIQGMILSDTSKKIYEEFKSIYNETKNDSDSCPFDMDDNDKW